MLNHILVLSRSILFYFGYLGLNLGLSQAISGNLEQSWAISGYIGLYQVISGYLGLSLAISIKYQLSWCK